MIIKFTHGITAETERWEVFGDIDRYSLHTRCVNPMVGEVVMFGDVSPKSELDFTEPSNPNKIWELTLFKGDKKFAEILVHSPIFVLNNDGRTVDKI
jgi:hypothetical protein